MNLKFFCRRLRILCNRYLKIVFSKGMKYMNHIEARQELKRILKEEETITVSDLKHLIHAGNIIINPFKKNIDYNTRQLEGLVKSQEKSINQQREQLDKYRLKIKRQANLINRLQGGTAK